MIAANLTADSLIEINLDYVTSRREG